MPDGIATAAPQTTGFCPPGCERVVEQPPEALDAFFSDASCDFCGGGQSLADNFELVIPMELCELRFWGVKGGKLRPRTQQNIRLPVNVAVIQSNGSKPNLRLRHHHMNRPFCGCSPHQEGVRATRA